MKKDTSSFDLSMHPGEIAHKFPPFEDNVLGTLEKKIWQASEKELDNMLAEYDVPSPSELGKLGSYIQTTPRHRVEDNLVKNDIVLIPVGSTENHGAHLPTGTDTLFVTQIIEGVRRYTVKQGRPVNLFWAPLNCGAHPHHHVGMTQTVMIKEDNLKETLIDVMFGLWNSGYRKQILVNNHGQFWVLEAAIQQFAKRHQLPGLYFATDWHKAVRKSFRTKDREGDFETDFVHADEAETSLALLMFPEMVDMSRAVDTSITPYLPPYHFDKAVSGLMRPHNWSSAQMPYPMEIHAVRQEGVIGKATLGDAKKAKRPVVHILRYLTLLLDDILKAFPPGKVPPIEETTLRTEEELKDCLRDPRDPKWKTAYALHKIGFFD